MLAKRNRILNTPVLMLIVLLGSDGSFSHGVIPFNSYEACHRSISRPVDKARYFWSDRVCMNSNLYDTLKSNG